jgi:Tfp pilus assembly protein PilV
MSDRVRLRDPSGIALITVLLVASLVSLVGLGLTLVLTIGQLAARNHRDGAVLLAAADAAIDLAADALATDDWQAVLGGWGVAAASDGAPDGLRAVDGQTVDLGAETNLLNCGRRAACSPAEHAVNTSSRPWGVNNPVWQLYLFGPLSSLAPLQMASATYVLVWIADDSRETDGRPDVDGGNEPGRHVLHVRSAAVGRDGARRVVEAELVRVCLEGRSACEPGIRVQSQREERHALP